MIPRRFFIFLFCFCFSFPVFAQSYIGFKGGINRSKSTFLFNINPALTTDRGELDGFYFSVPLEIKVNDLFDFLPALVFASEGSVFSVQVLEEERTHNNAIIYAKLPILAKLKLLQKKNYDFGIVAGVIPAYALSVKSFYYTFSDLRKNIKVPVNFETAGINRFDLAISFGINTEKTIAKGWKIVLDARYNLGLLDVDNHTELTTTTESFSLTLGILTPLFKKENELLF